MTQSNFIKDMTKWSGLRLASMRFAEYFIHDFFEAAKKGQADFGTCMKLMKRAGRECFGEAPGTNECMFYFRFVLQWIEPPGEGDLWEFALKVYAFRQAQDEERKKGGPTVKT